jgi:hypothetical protein
MFLERDPLFFGECFLEVRRDELDELLAGQRVTSLGFADVVAK